MQAVLVNVRRGKTLDEDALVVGAMPDHLTRLCMQGLRWRLAPDAADRNRNLSWSLLSCLRGASAMIMPITRKCAVLQIRVEAFAKSL